MKILSDIRSSLAKMATSVQSSKKVCIHMPRGIQTDSRVIREATALVKAGFNVSIVDVKSERAVSFEEEIQGISVKHIISRSWDIPTRFKPWFLFKMVLMIIRATISLLRTQADIYQAYDERALPACYFAAYIRGKPLIFDSPELPLSYPNVTSWHMLHTISTHILAIMMRHCRKVIAVSPPIVEEIHNRYHIPEVVLIRNLPTYRVVPKCDRLRQHIGIKPNTRIALYQGNIQADRGLDRLICAAAFLEHDVVIVIMGKGPKEMLSHLDSLMASQGVTDRVKIIPSVSYKELLDWTVSADIGLIIYPSDYSQNVQMMLPNKFFEYLMAGLPVLTSKLDVVADIIRNYEVGQIVTSLTSTDIGAAINTMLEDRLALDRMHNNALIAAKEFCWDKESQEFIRLYHDILTK